MKKLLYLFLLSLLGCAAGPVNLTVTHVQQTGQSREVYAKRGYMVYFATFPSPGPADTLKLGSVVKALPLGKGDSCSWVFRRVK